MIVSEVLYALLGLTGDVVIEDGATFRLSSGLDIVSEAERMQVDTLVKLGWYYREFKVTSDARHDDWKSRTGIYELAIFDGISDMISEYEMDIEYLEENERMYANSTLSYMIQHLQKVYYGVAITLYYLISCLVFCHIS